MSKGRGALALGALALALGGCFVPIPVGPPSPPAESDDGTAAIQEFALLLHEARAEVGCATLAWDATAAEVARAHSGDMRHRRYFGHETPEGVDPFERMRSAGIRFSAAAENIAQGSRTGEALFRQWSGSAGHRRNMLDCRFTRHGLGGAGDYWTHVLFAP